MSPEPSRKLKALLIQPPATGAVRSSLPQLEEDTEGIGYKPPIGILYIATTVKEMSGHEVKVVDAIAQGLEIEDVVAIAREYGPDVVGISAWTDFWWPAHETGRAIKEALPGAHLCYGGPHVCIYPWETLETSFVDSVVVGDGEMPFLRLCEALAEGRELKNADGFYVRSLWPEKAQFHIQKDLDALPIPDRTLLDMGLYTSVLGKSDRITTMITSRGCPGRCTYCKLYFQKTLCRSAQSVLEEFRRLRDLGVREVEIYDDTFTWSKDRVRELCEGLIREGIDVIWAIRDRVDRADPDLLKLMHRAGCRRVHYGIESGVDRVIKKMRKGITTDQARRAVHWARQAGMVTLTYFMFGNMEESQDDMRATIDFALELNADYAEFSITIPYPGTAMYLTALEQGILEEDFWLEHARDPKPEFTVPKVIEVEASLAELVDIRNEALRRFYFRPSYMLRQALSVRTPGEFLRKFRMGLRLFKGLFKRLPGAGS